MVVRLRFLLLTVLLFIPFSLFAQSDSTLIAAQSDSSKQDTTHLLIRQNPWSMRVLDHVTIAGLPFRGVDQYLPLLSGIVNVNGGTFVRGSRNGETGYLLDGVSVFNPWLNSDGVPLLPEAIEEIEAHTGPYGAELGSAGGGMINMRMKTGGERLEYSFNIQSDDFGSPGTPFGIGNFKAVNYGYRNIVGTIGGPLPLVPIKFFLAGQSNYLRSRQPMFFTPFKYENLVTDNLGGRAAGAPLPGPIEFKENYTGTNWQNTTTLQGNATAELFGVHLKLIGSYDDQEFTEGSLWPQVLQNYYRQKRDMLTRKVTKYVNVQASYSLSPDLDLDLSLAYYNRFARTYDPNFKNNWVLYGDSLANAQFGYPGFPSRYSAPYAWSTIYAFFFNDPSYPNGSFSTPTCSKENQNSLSLEGSLNWRMSDAWSVSAGGRLESWTMREWSATNILNLLQSMDINRDGVWDRTFSTDLERRVYMIRQGGITAIGYQYDNPGQAVDEGFDKPAEPFFASMYAQSSLSSDDVRLNVGARYEHIAPRFNTVPQTLNPVTGLYDWQDPPINETLDILDEKKLVVSEPANYLLPRVSLSVPMTRSMEFHAAYGQYVQMNQLSKLYISNITLSNLFNSSRVPYNLGGTPVTFTARPERSTHYEAGFTGQFSPNGLFTVVFFQKSLNNQLQLARIYNSTGTPITVGLLNNGKGVAQGLETTIDTKFAKRLRLLISYGYSEVQGRFSDATSDWRYVSNVQLPPAPDFLIPLKYDQTHRGSFISEVNFLKEDGPILEGLGLTLVFTMNSGQRYTQLMPIQYLGSVSPWKVGVRSLMDWRSFEPLGSENTSTTPWYFNFDIQVRKKFTINVVNAELSISVLNLFNRKHVLNVYPATGSPNDDGWLITGAADYSKAFPGYEEFYRTINLDNRWAYMSVTGDDIYGTPRQIRVGLKVEM